MTSISTAISNKQFIYAGLELSKNSWLLAIQVPGRVLSDECELVSVWH